MIFEFSDDGIARIEHEESDPYWPTKGFLDDPAMFLHLLDEQG